MGQIKDEAEKTKASERFKSYFDKKKSIKILKDHFENNFSLIISQAIQAQQAGAAAKKEKGGIAQALVGGLGANATAAGAEAKEEKKGIKNLDIAAINSGSLPFTGLLSP